jgi:predicted alpha/beta superfamily hydrolase
MIKEITLALLLIIICCYSKAQETFIITNQTSLAISDTLYLAGDFNRWNPKDPYFMAIKKNDKYIFNGSFNDSIIRFKITTGTWKFCEGNIKNQTRQNRELNLNSSDTFYLKITGWQIEKDTVIHSTSSNQVSLITDSFYIPQLNKYRRLWIYLPKDYHSSIKRYPVLYLHDGQNLFDDSLSYSGEWKVDETLAELEVLNQPIPIVIGIDNGNKDRLKEYCPWVHLEYGGGEGIQYANFLVTTLKPFIDRQYRTLPERKSSFIGGSSLGGLISHYLIFKYPDIFSKALVYSPAYWINQEVFEFTKSNHTDSVTLYMNLGTLEGLKMVSDFEKMKGLLYQLNNKNNHQFRLVEGERHHESFWQKEIKKDIPQLMKDAF